MIAPPVHLWHRLQFELRMFRTSGEQFQDLINHLHHELESDFQSVRPWGNWGDRGNDGWIPSAGHYFQVFGPKPTSALNAVEAVNKAVADFKKLKEEYRDIRRYTFFLNDRYQGIPAPVISTMQKLKNDYTLEDSQALGSNYLEKMFYKLDEDQRIYLCGGLPLEQPHYIDSRAVGDLLRYLADKRSPLSIFLDTTVPNFEGKIAFNGLCSGLAQILRTNAYHVSEVSTFFSKTPEDQQSIAEELRRLYEESKEIIPDTAPNAASVRYVWMVEQLVPETMRRHPHSEAVYQGAAQIVLAKYFETCDVYEHPTRTASA